MSHSHCGSKKSKRTDADRDGESVPSMRGLTEIKQQDHDDVFCHKKRVGEHLHFSQLPLFLFCWWPIVYSHWQVISQPVEAERESRQTCKCYITFSFGIKQSDITDVYGDRMKNLNSGNPPLKADGEQGDGNEPTAQHEKMSQKKYKFICLMRHIVYSAIFFLAVNDIIRDCRRPN